ncbi:MAG: PsbP-related protein, partial [Candidatus Berkelbacteria bacterium]|nr:PsbP-related protein [Candidatus Berkelbacteria bacterium]
TLWYYLVENNGKTFYLLTVDESNKSTLDKMVGTLSFGGATTSPSASPSAGYKMYSESQRGSFSFEYPKDWQILKTSAYDVDVEIMELLYTSGDVLNNSQISVEDLKNTYGSATLREIVNQIANSPDDQFISEVQLGGKTAIKLNSMNSIPPRTVYYALNNGYLLVISGESFEGNNNLNDAQQKNKNAFEHLISSFKFQ